MRAGSAVPVSVDEGGRGLLHVYYAPTSVTADRFRRINKQTCFKRVDGHCARPRLAGETPANCCGYAPSRGIRPPTLAANSAFRNGLVRRGHSGAMPSTSAYPDTTSTGNSGFSTRASRARSAPFMPGMR